MKPSRLAILAATLVGCGGPAAPATPEDAGGSSDAPAADAPVDGGSDVGMQAPDACAVPDILFVLGRNEASATTLDGGTPPDTTSGRAQTRWGIAAAAIAGATTGLMSGSTRVGVEVFPSDPGGGACPTLTAFLSGTQPTNPSCQVGQVLVHVGPPDPSQIAAALDPENATICRSTAIGGAAFTASGELGPLQAPGRPQVVVLLTDGLEECMSDPLSNVQGLAGQGIRVYVVALSDAPGMTAIDVSMLNNLACAGMTAPNFSQACMRPDSGLTGYRAVQPFGPQLFTLTQDQASLTQALETIVGSVCCGCRH